MNASGASREITRFLTEETAFQHAPPELGWLEYQGRSGESMSLRVSQEISSTLESWVDWWYVRVAATFLKEYLATAHGASFMPDTREELRLLLTVFMLERAIYDIEYELDKRLQRVQVPLKELLHLIGAEEPSS